jgi:hypothetical protein
MRILLLGMMLLSASVGFAQKTASPQKFSETITEQDLREHLFTLAGKEMEGRETATEGQKKAAAYIERFFRTNGLKPGNKDSYQQILMFTGLTGQQFRNSKQQRIPDQ